MSSKALLHQAYENSQGIHDYISQEIYEQSVLDPQLKRPLSSVALHDAENICAGSKLYELIKLYADRKVYTHYGLSLLDYLDLPHDIAAFIMTDCTERLQKEYNNTSDVLDSINLQKNK